MDPLCGENSHGRAERPREEPRQLRDRYGLTNDGGVDCLMFDDMDVRTHGPAPSDLWRSQHPSSGTVESGRWSRLPPASTAVSRQEPDEPKAPPALSVEQPGLSVLRPIAERVHQLLRAVEPTLVGVAAAEEAGEHTVRERDVDPVAGVDPLRLGCRASDFVAGLLIES